MPHGGTHFNPSSWEEALGANIEDYYTPEEQFAQFRTGIRPQWQYQAPLRNIQSNLQQRYMLGFPGSQPSSDPAGFYNNFRDYLGTVNPNNYLQTPEVLRSRARTAADIANMTTAELAEGYAPGSAGFNQAAWYRMMYGGEDSLQNQMGLVNLLASQRPAAQGGGQYQGRMGQAISNMLGELYQARVAGGDPGSSFLQWYLDQTA